MRYQPLEWQKEILNSKISIEELNILQRNSITRIKERVQSRRMYFHSSNEIDENIRIIIFAFLVKLFTNYSSSHQRQLNKFKNLIYESKLSSSITSNQGIQINQLFKLFALKINEIQIGQNVEERICNLINSSTFFEDIIFIALRNKLDLDKYSNSDVEIDSLKEFFEKEFSIRINIFPKNIKGAEENRDEIILYDFKSHLHKKIIFGQDNQSSSSSSLSKERSNRRISPLSLTKHQESIKMDSSIIKMEQISPSNKNSSGNKSSNRKVNPFELRESDKIKQKKKQRKKGVFDIFCCCD